MTKTENAKPIFSDSDLTAADWAGITLTGDILDLLADGVARTTGDVVAALGSDRALTGEALGVLYENGDVDDLAGEGDLARWTVAD